MIASVVIPATFQGTVYLIVLWLLMGLAGLALIITSGPVKRPLIAALRHQLEIPNALPPLTTNGDTEDPDPDTLRRLALSEICEELEAAKGVLNGPQMSRFFVKHKLATFKWERYGPVLAASDTSLHKEVRPAYRAMDAVNKRGIQRGFVAGGEKTVLLDSTLVDEAREAVDAALSALDSSIAN